jgi:hypothetical protein
MARLTQESGQALAGYILAMAPAVIVVAFVIAVVTLVGQ